MKIQLKEGHAPTARTLEAKMYLQDVGVSQRNTVLNRNSRLLLWWSQQKKDVNDVNLQFDNSQSGHAPSPPLGPWPPRGGMAGLAPWIRHCCCYYYYRAIWSL